MAPRDILEDSFYEQEKRRREEFKDQFRPDKRGRKWALRDGKKTLLLDLVFILVIIGVIYPFMSKRFGPVRSVGEYSYNFSAVVLNGELHQSMEIWASPQADSKDTMTVRFIMEDQVTEQQDLAPAPEERRLFSLVVPWDSSDKLKVYCEVDFQGKTMRFSRALE